MGKWSPVLGEVDERKQDDEDWSSSPSLSSLSLQPPQPPPSSSSPPPLSSSYPRHHHNYIRSLNILSLTKRANREKDQSIGGERGEWMDEAEDNRFGRSGYLLQRHRTTIPWKRVEEKNGRNWRWMSMKIGTDWVDAMSSVLTEKLGKKKKRISLLC